MKNTNEHGIIAMYRVVHSIKLVRLHSYQVEKLNKQTIYRTVQAHSEWFRLQIEKETSELL